MHRVQLRPLFADVDAMNVVYYGNYLRFFERGRAELMRTSGCPYAWLEAQGLHLPVTEAGLRYRQAARYDQLIAVETRVAWLKKASLRFDYRIVRPTENNGEQELVSGHTIHACTTNQGKVRPMPEQVIQALELHVESCE